MKTNIHPTWHSPITITCNCGESFVTGSTLDDIKVDICSACHPFYTGEMKFVDVQGRVEKFQAKQQQAAQYRDTKKKKVTDKKQQTQQSLRDMLQAAKKQTAQPAVNEAKTSSDKDKSTKR